MGDTRIRREARHHELELRRAIGTQLRGIRIAAGLTLSAVARAAGIDRSFLGRIERAERRASLTVLVRVATVLGAEVSLRAFAAAGPALRDRFQAPMTDALLQVLHARWLGDPEVVVRHPVHGIIDLLISERTDDPLAIVTEMQSELRRLEAQLRWHREKEGALRSADCWPFLSAAGSPTTSRLLVLRSTRANRDLVNRYEATFRAAYPARCADVLAALRTADAPWPGAGLIWMRVERGRATILPGPPRGVRLGR